MRSNNVREAMVATLGVEPQVVTIALDNLLAEQKNIDEVTVIYTRHPDVLQALDILKKEFSGQVYPGITLRPVAVTTASGTVHDFLTPGDLQGLLRTLYSEVRRVRGSGALLHFCLAGGRKMMSVFGMVVSQLLFGPEDRAWYLVTEGWQPGSAKRLHAAPGDRVWLLPVPVLRWNEAGTLVQAMAELNDPAEVVAWYERLTREGQAKRKGEFVRRWLTPAEREVTRQACLGLDNVSIAAALHKREQTVANQLGGIYEKLREWLGYPPRNVDRSVLIAEFAPYFSLAEEGGDQNPYR